MFLKSSQMLLLLLGQGPPTLRVTVCMPITWQPSRASALYLNLNLSYSQRSPFKTLGYLGRTPIASQTQYLFLVKWVEKTEQEPLGVGWGEGKQLHHLIVSPQRPIGSQVASSPKLNIYSHVNILSNRENRKISKVMIQTQCYYDSFLNLVAMFVTLKPFEKEKLQSLSLTWMFLETGGTEFCKNQSAF